MPCLSSRLDTCGFSKLARYSTGSRKRLESYFTGGDNYSCPYSKVTAILIKVSTLRGWNGEPIGSHFLRHIEDGNIDSERRGTSQKSRRDWLPVASFRPTKIER